jgi:hypothetical protein
VFHPAFLGDILKFNATVGSLERKKPRMKLVFQAGRDRSIQAQMTFLLGCHMIMSHGVGFEETFLAFQTLYRDSTFNHFGQSGMSEVCQSIKSCWRAMCYAKCLSWVDSNSFVNTNDGEDASSIQIDEYLHYAE